MAELAKFMPTINISKEELQRWGKLWAGTENPETSQAKTQTVLIVSNQ